MQLPVIIIIKYAIIRIITVKLMTVRNYDSQISNGKKSQVSYLQ